MTDRDDCLADILKAIKDRKDRKYVRDHLDDLDERAQADDSASSPREKYARAAKEMLEEQATNVAVYRRATRLQALAFRDLRTYLDAAAAAPRGSYALGIEARLVGRNEPFFDARSRHGNQDSVGAVARGAEDLWTGGAELAMRQLGRDNPKFAGADQVFASHAIEREIFIEKWELEQQAAGRRAQPGRTKNEMALEIAKILQQTDNRKIDALNSKGAWITRHSAFMAPMMHDPDRMLAAAGNVAARVRNAVTGNRAEELRLWEEARRAWAAKTLQRIDAKRMFGTEADADKKLAEMFGGLVTGDHAEIMTAVDEPVFMNLAAKVSVHREFVFKSAEAQLDHMADFGRFQSPTDAWVHGMRKAADRYALMDAFGPWPKKNFEEAIAYAKNKTMSKPGRRELDKAAPEGGGGWLRNRYAVVSGEADIPIANIMSGIVAGNMAVQRMAKLGLTPFAMIQDNVTISRELAYQGLGIAERWATVLSGYLQGAEGSAKQEVAELLHTGLRARERGIAARFDVLDVKNGALARLENRFFRWTGISPMTENKRADAKQLMAYHFGKLRGTDFAAIGEAETRIMQAFGIGEKEWALLNKADWHTVEGETVLTPDIAMTLSDADVQAYLKARGPISEQAAIAGGIGAPEVIASVPNVLERTKTDLAMKLWAYYSERGNYAVIEVGPRERAMLYQGTQAGSKLNLALKLLFQFKQFPLTMMTKVWGREIHGGERGLGRVAGLVELAVGSTLAGMAANYMNQLAKGQDPNAQWRNNPWQAIVSGFTRGGAGSIYGDFLFGEWSRFGLSATATIAGPTLGQFDKLMETYSALTHPSRWKSSSLALALRTVRENTPFANMIVTKAAVDYLVMYRLQEWLNPGYLDRLERTMKDKQGIEFWLRPTRVSR